MEKIVHTIGNQKRVRMVIIISDKIDFKSKPVSRNNKKVIV